MNLRKRMMSVMLAAIMLCSLSVTAALAKDESHKKQSDATILFTHDLHSHLEEFQTKEGMAGGFARLKTVVDQKRGENPATVLVDGGDFSMGTLYQTIYETHAPELTLMGKIGYDAVTFGNHEFDYRSEGVANMLYSAVENAKADKEVKLPAFVIANIDWKNNQTKENKVVETALDTYGSTAYTIVEREGIRMGIFGLLGEDAAKDAPKSGFVFSDMVERAQKAVYKMKVRGVDMIICLSHGGTNENARKSEDEILAKKVPEIDVVVSGHTHTKLEKAKQVGDTYIVSAGSYGESLGELDLVKKKNGRWKMTDYKLNRLDESVKQDTAILGELESYKKLINEEYLSKFKYDYNKVLADNKVAFSQMDVFGEELKEDTLGNLIADAYVYAAQKATDKDGDPVVAAVAPSGTIRDTLQKGQLTVADAFAVSSLGIGPDRIPGYPLVSFYLTGKELKLAAEIDASVSRLMPSAQLYPSGMSWTFNSNRLFLNRTTEVSLDTHVPYSETVKKAEIDNQKLYRVVTGLYSVQMLGAVEGKTRGLLKITPKTAQGDVIEDYEEYIVYNSQGEEIKEWYALASYLESFGKNDDGIPQVPTRYAAEEDRKVQKDSWNPIALFKQPNRYAFAVYIMILLLAGTVVLVVRIIRKRRNN